MSSSLPAPIGSFEALAESAPDAILTIDAESTILSANAAAERVLGYRPEELIGQALTMIIPPRLRAAHDAGIARYLRTGQRRIPWTGVELPAVRKDGSEFPAEISFGEFTDESGRHVFSGFIRDISDRVRVNRELQQTRAMAERALQEVEAIGRIIDAPLSRGTYDTMVDDLLTRLCDELQADSAALFLLDETDEKLHVRAASGVFAALGREVVVGIGEGVSGKVALTNTPLVLHDGAGEALVAPPEVRSQLRSLAAVPIQYEGAVIGVLHVGSREPAHFSEPTLRLLRLVGERTSGAFARTRIYEELVRHTRQERALRQLAQAVTGALKVTDVMRHVAEGAMEISSAMGAYVEQVIDDRSIEIVAATGQGAPPVGQRFAFPGSLTDEIIRNREPIFLEGMEGIGAAMAPYLAEHCPQCSVFLLPIFAEARTLGALVLVRGPHEPRFDESVVTHLRTLGDLASIALQKLLALAESERRRKEAEAAVKARDEVLSVVSHDLRNPVSTVAMSASLLLDTDIQLTAEQRHAQLDIIKRSAHRMNRLIQDLLDVARIEGNRLRISCRCENPSALALEVLESFRIIAGTKGIAIDADIAKDLRRVHVDRDRVIQLLSNYMNNALKFAGSRKEGGRVTLRLRATEGGGVIYSVTDNGPGIPQEELPKVFERFWQSKRTAHMGTGLGLAVAQGIARAHRGSVRVESTPDEATTFYFEVPRSRECD
jgi:PAS domain S-box-containing protein